MSVANSRSLAVASPVPAAGTEASFRQSCEPEVAPMNDEQDQPRGKRHTAGRAALAVPATILMPFTMVWRSLRSIWNDQASRGILITAALLLAAGTVLFMWIEGFSLVDSFYFCFITLSTIGYGDFSPTTDLGKIVTVIYGIAGLGVIAALVSAIATQRRRDSEKARDSD